MARQLKKYNPETFFTIKAWMVRDLRLKGNKLLVYAFIYAYSCNSEGNGCYYGGNEGIRLYTGCATSSIPRIVTELINEGLIEVQTATLNNGLSRNYYRVSTYPLENVKESLEEHGWNNMGAELSTIHTFDEVWNHIDTLSKNIKRVGERRSGKGGAIEEAKTVVF